MLHSVYGEVHGGVEYSEPAVYYEDTAGVGKGRWWWWDVLGAGLWGYGRVLMAERSRGGDRDYKWMTRRSCRIRRLVILCVNTVGCHMGGIDVCLALV